MSQTITKPKDSVNRVISSQIVINNIDITNDFKIHKILTFKEINKISRAKIQFFGGNANQNSFEESEKSIFNPGNQIEIKLGYDQKNSTVFKGIIDKHSIVLKNGYQKQKSNSILVIECVDKSILLTNKYTSEVYQNKSDSQIIKSILQKINGLSFSVESTEIVNTLFPKYNIDDWNFIVKRAKRNGFVVINSDNNLIIKKPELDKGNSVLDISNSGATISFEAKLDSSQQYNEVKLSSYDQFSNKKFSKTSSNPIEIVENNKVSGKILSALTSPKKIEIDLPQEIESNELKTLADSMITDSRVKRITGTAKFKGVPFIEVDSTVNFLGFGNNFDGNVYVTGVNQELEDGYFLTEISFGLKEDFFSESNFINKNNLVGNISGLHIGKVTEIDNDPKNQFRIKVMIPALSDNNDGVWAKLSTIYTTNNGGALFIPEIGSQVILSFVADDPRHPIILGTLYNNNQKPNKKILKENNFKSIITKNNLKLEFDDRDKKITISSPKGNSIILNEKNNEITIIDQNKNSIKTSSNGIEIFSRKDINIKSGGSIDISSSNKLNLKSNSNLNLSGSNINNSARIKFSANGSANSEIKSSGVTTVKGSIVQIN